MDELNTKIKAIKTEKTNKVRPENIKSGVSIFGITGTLEEDYAKFIETDRADNNYICYIYKPTLADGVLEDIEDIFENDNQIIQTLINILESTSGDITDTLEDADVNVLNDIIILCDMVFELFLFKEDEYYDVARLHIESTSAESADIINTTVEYGMYGVSFSIETDEETGEAAVSVGEPYDFIDTTGTDATASDIISGKTAYVNGEYIEGTLVPSSSKNYQSLIGMYGTSYASYSASSLKLTVAKTGTYTIEWLSRRLSTSGTYGTALYIDGTRYGSNYETWSLVNYRNGVEYQTPSAEYQYNTVHNVSLTQGQVVEIYGKSNANNNWIFHHTLLLKEE